MRLPWHVPICPKFTMALVNDMVRQLEMRYAGGGIVRHLGLQNYKGPVPAMAELIANAWDADAGEVHISIPLGVPIKSDHIISVRDNGCGMAWVDCNEKYLVIGRNRRVAEKTDRSPRGRPLMAHKGLGKLAGFGIANTIEIKTIKNKKLTHFVMRFSEIDKLEQGETYRPEMIADEEDVELPNGTEIILRDLNLQSSIPENIFLRSMASRFAVLSDEFKVYINGGPLKKEEVPLQFRFPEKAADDVIEVVDKWGKTILPSGAEIRWWIGFTEKPIQVEGVRGVSVLTRGRVSQDPWDFDLSGGAYGQHGLRYMTGEIVADFLDDGLEKDSDLIITNRSSIAWDHPKAKPLYDWAKSKIRFLLSEWADRRSEKTVETVKKEYPELVQKINQFQPRERRELNSAMKSFAQIPTIEPERLVKIFDYVIEGYKDKAFVDMLEEIKKLPPEERVQTLEILKEFDILEAVRVHKIVSSHVRVIRTFRDMIEAGVPEKPDMHEHIRKYPWLLGVKYQPMYYEKSLQKILEERFGAHAKDISGKERPDFVCMRSGSDVLVIELKRPGEKVGLAELHQTSGYVDTLREWVATSDTVKLMGVFIKAENIEGYLIAYEFRDEPRVRREIKRLERDGIHVCKWYDVLMRAEDEHRKYLEVVKDRAPKDDPRIVELESKEIA